MGISFRLQEERQRLGLTQEVIAARLGATKRSVINWEGGAALPGAEVLSRYAVAGADVLYILTSQRSQAAAEVDLLPSDERVLVDAYRRCNAEAKRNLIQTAALLSAGMGASPSQPAAPGGGVRQTSHSNNAVQVHGSKNKISTKRS